jgi:hypothetical protein
MERDEIRDELRSMSPGETRQVDGFQVDRRADGGWLVHSGVGGMMFSRRIAKAVGIVESYQVTREVRS